VDKFKSKKISPKEGSNLTGKRFFKSGTPGESRTPNLLIRSQALYPIELRVQIAKVN
jgi:hypothetical protein